MVILSLISQILDWNKAGYVTKVKDQGQCGSCWSFSTTGSIESAVAIATGRLISLSEQQLLDCPGSHYHERACSGGSVPFAYDYVINNGGLCRESDYPYQTHKGSCRVSSCTPASTISSFANVTTNNEAAMKIAAAQQPLSVFVDAQAWPQFYESGVFDGECGTSLDHYVLVAGYGTEDGQDYWYVKNSWGADWGLNGYILLARNLDSTVHGQCGIAMKPRYPIH